MRACGCGKPIGPQNKTGLCKSCAAKRRYRDPEERARASAIKKAALQDPEKRARVVAAALRTLEAVHAAGRHKVKPKMPGRGLLYRVPPARREEYIRLRKGARLGAAAAFAIIQEDERSKVRRKTLASQQDVGA